MAVSGDDLVVASLPEEQKKLVCVEFPGELTVPKYAYL